MKQAIKRYSVLCLLAVLGGCASAPPPPTPAQSFAELSADPAFSPYAMRAIASNAFDNGDFDLLSDALWRLCQRSVATAGGTEDCSNYLDVAIIQNNVVDQAQANMALYFLTRDAAYHQRATVLLPDNNDYYQQLLAARLEDCLQVSQQSEPLAMQCYVSGKHFKHQAALEKALSLFERYNAKHNMADTYFVLAQLAAQDNKLQQAEKLAARSSLILSQLGETQKAQQVRQWRQETLRVPHRVPHRETPRETPAEIPHAQ